MIKAVAYAAVLLTAGAVQAGVFNMTGGLTSLEFVPVGNPGNAGELSGWAAGGYGPNVIAGAVDYTFSMGKFEVTAGQYTEFLNAVAKTDTYGLYNTSMWSSTYGCKIERSGNSGSYTYSVASDWANRPVNYVSWGDAARFANWLTKGQPAGEQGLATTEDGSYYLNGVTSDIALIAVTRKTVAQGGRYYIPSEDEWYKAAYHKNDGVTGNYFDYTTSSNSMPSNDLLTPDGGNNANFYQGDYTIDGPYYRTEAGQFELSDSPYATFDQGGNVWEWTEAVLYGAFRGMRGGSFGYDDVNSLHAAGRDLNLPAYEDDYIGFRVTAAPEPASFLGDCDRDGDVDIFDWSIFQPNFGSSEGASWETGDFDGDVDVFDWAIFQPNYGKTAEAVPEPATMALLAIASLLAPLRRR
ncbi:MAG: SUMF1/EgtB/PvdO family nonheme iron enzyme [Planctomycetes bacterium]|nr:SUMF1/EgtB/PvdO family nonheme iron enzyme [Planctomycetota bacterium]